LAAVFVSANPSGFMTASGGNLFSAYDPAYNFVVLGDPEPFSRVTLVKSGEAAVLSWDYWNGSDWSQLTVSESGLFDYGYDATGQLRFLPPTDWTSRSFWEKEGYFIRANFAASPSGITLMPGAAFGTLQPSFQKQASDEAAVGMRLTATLYNSGEFKLTIYRDTDAIQSFQSRIPMSGYSFLDSNLRVNQTCEYYAEILDLSQTPAQYQVATSGPYTWATGQLPLPPTDVSVEVKDHGDPMGLVTVSWSMSPGIAPGRLPERFILSVSGLGEFPLDYRDGVLDYTQDVQFVNSLQGTDRIAVVDTIHPTGDYQGPEVTGEVLNGVSFKTTLSSLWDSVRFPLCRYQGILGTGSPEWQFDVSGNGWLYILVPSELPEAWVPDWLSEFTKLDTSGIVLASGLVEWIPKIYFGYYNDEVVELPELFGDGSPPYTGTLPYRYIPLWINDSDYVKSLRWDLYSENSIGRSARVSTYAGLKKWLSMPAPSGEATNLARAEANTYSYKVNLSVPDYSGVADISGFEIDGGKFTPKTMVIAGSGNLYSFTESGTTLPANYFIRSYIKYQIGWDLEFKYSDPFTLCVTGLGDIYKNFSPSAPILPAGVSAPALSVYYTGPDISGWASGECARIVSPAVSVVAETTGEVPTTPAPTPNYAVAVPSGSTYSFWTYYSYPAGSWAPLAPRLAVEYSGQFNLDNPIIVERDYINSLTGSGMKDYWELTPATGLVTIGTAFERRLAQCGATGTSIATNTGILSLLDNFTLKCYPVYGLSGRTFQGPALTSVNRPTALNWGFDPNVSMAPELRVGASRNFYGDLTDINSVAGMIAAINAVPGYNAIGMMDTPLTGNELAVEINRIKLQAKLPTGYVGLPPTGTLFESMQPNPPAGYYIGVIHNQYAEETAALYASGCNIVLGTGTFVDRGYDGSYMVYSGRLAVRYEEDVRIQILPPRGTAVEPWYPLITPGRFVKGDNTYSVTEFPMQDWSPKYGAPYKDASYEQARMLDPFTIQLRNSPLHLVGRNFDLIIEGKRKTSLVGDWDIQNGLLFLTKPISMKSHCLVSYTFKETAFVYKGVNLNPHKRFGNNILGKYVGIFIVDRSDMPSSVVPSDLYGLPRSIYHQTFGTLADLEFFARTVQDPANQWPATEFVDHDGNPTNASLSASIPMLLGYYYINPGKPSDITFDDARARGGGLVQSPFETLFERDRNVAGYYDIGWLDGMPFGQQAVLVEVPSGLTDTLDEEKIINELRAHVPIGTMLVVNYADGIRVNGETVWPLPG
jgi:hypothetical protein